MRQLRDNGTAAPPALAAPASIVVSLEQRLQNQIGTLVFQVHALQAENDHLKAALAKAEQASGAPQS